MIGPSDLCRVPFCQRPTQPEELLRYAHLEYGAADFSWAVTRPTDPRTGVREWLASHLRLPRTGATPPRAGVLRTGLAAVHFDGEGTRDLEIGASHPRADHPCDLLATSALVLTVQPNDPQSDELCTCDH